MPLVSTSLAAKELDITVRDNKHQPLSEVIVYLEPIDNMTLPKTEKVVEIGQLNKSFIPYASVIQAGNAVNFRNQDDITHHIYSPVGENRFSFKIRAGQQQSLSNFDTAGELAMGCNIHDWMAGYLLIVETPYFAITDINGRVDFSVQQAGEYNIIVWHPNLEASDNRVQKTIDTSEGRAFSVDLIASLSKIPEQKSEDDFDFLSDY